MHARHCARGVSGARRIASRIAETVRIASQRDVEYNVLVGDRLLWFPDCALGQKAKRAARVGGFCVVLSSVDAPRFA
jgi:hypothetical protein